MPTPCSVDKVSMRRHLPMLFALAVGLAGCASNEAATTIPASSSADTIPTLDISTPSSVPPIDQEFHGEYGAQINFEPQVPESGPLMSLGVGDDLVILEGWFVPKDGPPVGGVVDRGALTNPHAKIGDGILLDLVELTRSRGHGLL